MNKNDTGIEKEIISFFPTQTSKELKTFEIKQILSRSSFNIQLYVFKEGTSEEFLHFIHKFFPSKKQVWLQYLPKLESELEQLLQTNSQNEWNRIKCIVSPSSQTIATFNERNIVYKMLYIPDSVVIDNNKKYIQRVQKMIKIQYPSSSTGCNTST